MPEPLSSAGAGPRAGVQSRASTTGAAPGDPERVGDSSGLDPAAGMPRRLGVLIVDDDEAVRALLRAVLQRDNRFEIVAEAVDGSEAVLLAELHQPSVVLLDLVMPRVGGHEALPKILRVSPRSMVLVLSALSADDEAATSFGAGAFAYLEKSVMGPGLAEEIVKLHERFGRALAGETVWATGDPVRIRR